MVKDRNPLLNNFDRAVEMEKSITLEMLKSIDIKKVTQEIEKHMSEKSEKTTVSPTSSVMSSSTLESEKPKKKTKATQKRIPEFDINKMSESTAEIMNESSISFSTISEF